MDCSGSPLSFQYEVHMLNPRQGWQKEFSMDHIGVLPLCLLLFVLYLSMAFLQLRHNAISHKMHGMEWVSHPMIRVLTTSLMSFGGAMLLFTFHYTRFALNGRGIGLFYVMAKLLHALAKFLLMSIMLLLARGRCISYPMTFGDVRWLTKMLLPFVLLCVSLELWSEFAESNKYTHGFVYHSPIGVFLVAVDVFLSTVFFSSLMTTLRWEGDYEKKHFYKVLGLCCGLWFLTLPATTFVALLIDPWVRFKVLLAITNLSHAAACAVIVAIMRPDATHMDRIPEDGVTSDIAPSLLGHQKQKGVKFNFGPLQESLPESEGQ